MTVEKKPNIYTERLLLRPFTLKDINAFHQLCSDKEVMQYIGDGCLPTLEMTQQSIERWIKHYNTHGYGLLALVLRETNELMGFCGLIKQTIQGNEKIELGYRLGKKYWNKGFATEAALKIQAHAFQDLKIEELISIIQPNNKASRNVAEKLGMRLLQECDYNGHNVYIFQMFRQDYLTKNNNLLKHKND